MIYTDQREDPQLWIKKMFEEDLEGLQIPVVDELLHHGKISFRLYIYMYIMVNLDQLTWGVGLISRDT